MENFSFFTKKLGSFLLSVFIVITVTFFLMHAVPGDPFSDEKGLSEEVLRAMKLHYGLDKPLFVQYLHYLKGVLSFDFGPSLKYSGRAVTDVILEGFPVSFCLGLEALTLSTLLGVSLGSLSSVPRVSRSSSATCGLKVAVGATPRDYALASAVKLAILHA